MRYILRILSIEVKPGPFHSYPGLRLSKGLSLHSIGLASREKSGQPKLVKLLKVAYYVKLLDLHRSNPFGLKSLPVMDSPNLPESW
jgi:eukaryotic translation initiation factor 2-alpha kinase 4